MKDLSITKLYYSISEVSKITGVEQYVLRYWESEFSQLKPQKNRAGNRIYTNKDIQIILQIKILLRDKKYTISGAKKILETFVPEEEGSQQPQTPKKVEKEILPEKVNPIKDEVEEIKQTLEKLKIVKPSKTPKDIIDFKEKYTSNNDLQNDLIEIRDFLKSLLRKL